MPLFLFLFDLVYEASSWREPLTLKTSHHSSVLMLQGEHPHMAPHGHVPLNLPQSADNTDTFVHFFFFAVLGVGLGM